MAIADHKPIKLRQSTTSKQRTSRSKKFIHGGDYQQPQLEVPVIKAYEIVEKAVRFRLYHHGERFTVDADTYQELLGGLSRMFPGVLPSEFYIAWNGGWVNLAQWGNQLGLQYPYRAA